MLLACGAAGNTKSLTGSTLRCGIYKIDEPDYGLCVITHFAKTN